MAAYLKALLNKKTSAYLAAFFFLLLIYTLTRHTVDYLNFWLLARETVYGNADLYRKHIAFSYPPFFYNIIIFFSIFTVKTSLALWYCFNIVILTFSTAMLLKIIYPESTFFRQDSKSRTKTFLPFILALPIIADNLYLGQANIFIFFLCVCAVYFLENKNPVASGLFIAAATAIKLTPAFFIFYFLYRKEFKAVFAALLGLPVFFLLLPSLFYGFERSWYLSSEFVKLVVMPFFRNDAIIRETVYYTHPNQSLDAFLVRHFTDLGVTSYPGWLHSHLDPAKYTGEQMKRAGLIIKAILLLISAVALWRTRKFKLVAKFEYAIVFLLILYISPSSWLSHYISVLFAYYVSVAYITDIYADRTGKLILTLCLGLAILLTYTGVNPFMQSLSGMFIGNFILFLGMLFVCFKESYRKAL